MKFLIQKIDGNIVHDFSFMLLNAIRYHEWLRNDKITVKYFNCIDYTYNYKPYLPKAYGFQPYHKLYTTNR